MKERIAFLGVGNMARAMLGGIIASESFDKENIALFDRVTSQYNEYSEYPFYIANSIVDATKFGDYIVLSVKPQNYKEVLSEIRNSGIPLKDKTFISLGAGIATETIEKCLGQSAAIVRTMPNTPMFIGFGVTALCPNASVSAEAFEKVESIFSARGSTIQLSEDKMNSIIAVTSSSPAYIYLMIDALLAGARQEGIDSENTLDIICDMIIGSVQMVKDSGKTPQELIAMVKSPKGTTEQALIALDKHGFVEAIKDAMHCCTIRAEELSRDFSDSIN